MVGVVLKEYKNDHYTVEKKECKPSSPTAFGQETPL
jgi:hypothetical protein